MLVFLKDGKTGQFGEYYISGEERCTVDGCTTFKVDPEEVYPEMVLNCDIDVTTEVSVKEGEFMTEDELLCDIIDNISKEADIIRDAADNIGKETEGNWSADHLFQIDSRLDVIKEQIQRFRDVIATIYNYIV